MKLLVDEDLASRELISRLDASDEIDVLAPERESSDEDVWRRAQTLGAAILTGNVVDFLRLAARQPSHHGLLLVYRRNDTTRDLRAVDIVASIVGIARVYPDGIDELVLFVNDFVRGSIDA